MLFANAGDISRCTAIVKKVLVNANISLNHETIEKITIDVMNISYSKGGDYSDYIIQSFSETYIEDELYKKYL